ncbi:MAG: hypothetical protein B7O98_07550 [Zestosphaera tikiterensis]|uniref:DUF5320 domain-containing protein n=1 Tax=Zestosphaera tikiterensis TaxID=1973259 RepID=A0A2R7Y4Q0_9CREN|nr:MAG: hypothetical protein B7O98_07550 [Zestosphaera tikiterensis]
MGWWGPYPGRGPWRHLPPWERPGWVFRGRGWCWWYWGYRPYQPVTEAEALRSYKEWLERYIKGVEGEVAAVKEEIKRVEDRLKELEKAGKS